MCGYLLCLIINTFSFQSFRDWAGKLLGLNVQQLVHASLQGVLKMMYQKSLQQLAAISSDVFVFF